MGLTLTTFNLLGKALAMGQAAETVGVGITTLEALLMTPQAEATLLTADETAEATEATSDDTTEATGQAGTLVGVAMGQATALLLVTLVGKTSGQPLALTEEATEATEAEI